MIATEFTARLRWMAKDVKGEKRERERRSVRNAMEGDRKRGGRVRERETEGDRRRKSLRHG